MAGAEAQAGFYYQNLVAALQLLELIDIGSRVRSVTLENPARAKHIDDLIIDTDSGARFVQVKWSEDQSTSFTLASLVAEDEGGSLWEKLARGYQQIHSEQGEKVVELLSTRRAGINKQPAQGFVQSLQQFITEFHEPYISSAPGMSIESVPAYQYYEQTIEKLKLASGISDAEIFAAFLRSLRFKLSQDDRDTVSARVRTRLSQLGIEQQQFGVLLDECVKWSIGSARITADLVLEKLGLSDRFAERLSHRFPVDEELWVPTPELFMALDRALESLSSGFIVVVGEPGAGKSTALTKFLRANSSIKFGYYCFIPDERAVGNERLQEDAFVRSVCSGLKDAYPDFKFPKAYAPASVELLNDWLQELSKSNERVVFLIDGVDHVDRKTRESLLSKPLTSVLDGHLPDNVLIIVTTRYEQALPSAIVSHLRRESVRRIVVKRFDRLQVSEFMLHRGVSHDSELLEQIFVVSAGVPIYLEYLAKILFDMNIAERRKYLRQAPTLRNDRIDHFHDHMWQEWSADLDTVYLIAILVVRQEYTTPETLRKLLGSVNHPLSLAVVKQKLQAISYVLKVSEAKGFAINHASLAEFVSERTADYRSEITRAILDWYEAEPTTDESWRHRFRHLLDEGLHEEALNACDDDWVNRAWSCYRPMSEIQRNLDLIWRASIQSNDLVSFIRIGFLRQQAGLIEQNVELKPVEMAMTLMDIGLSDGALSAVWDGEFCMVSPADFALFAEHYACRIGRTLPTAIVRESLATRGNSGYPGTAAIYRVASLVMEPAALLGEIAQLRWQSKRQGSHAIAAAEAIENGKLNLELQLKVLQSLVDRVSIDKLIAISSQKLPDCILGAACQAALAVAYSKSGSIPDAIVVAEGIKLECLPHEFLTWVQVQFARYLIPFVGVESISIPTVPNTLAKNHHFNPDLIGMFEAFRSFMLNRVDGAAALRASCVHLRAPIGDIVTSLISLAEFWVKSASGKAVGDGLVSLKAICDRLAIHPETFQSDSDTHYHGHLYAGSAHELYQHVWDCAAEFLDKEDQTALGSYWLEVNGGERCRRFPSATRKLAESLIGNRAAVAAQIQRRLLDSVEAAARAEEETMTLVPALLDVARTWGACGFREEAVRLWNDVATVACGVHNRKDYQFSEILIPLKLAHDKDPEGSRHRLAEQLELAHHLEDTGAGKQVAIAIEGLLGLVAQWWPAEVFRGVVAEERQIFRERALGGVLSELNAVSSFDKRILLAVLKTMSRWQNYGHFDDETLPAMRGFFAALLKQRSYDVADETYEFARQMFLVEKNRPRLLGEWAVMRNAIEPANEDAQRDEVMYWEPEEPSEEQSETNYSDDFRTQVKATLERLDPGDTAAFRVKLEEFAHQELRERTATRLSQERDDWRRALLATSSLKSVPPDLDQEFEVFLESFEQQILGLYGRDDAHLREAAEEVVRETVDGFSLFVGVPQLSFARFKEAFDLDAWLDKLLRPVGIGYRVEGELRALLPDRIQGASFTQLPSWLALAREKLTSDARALALVEVAKRYRLANPEEAFELLEEARDSIADFFFEHLDLCREICELSLEIDASRGCRFMLDSFRHQYNKYPTSLVYRLGGLIDSLNSAMALDGVALYDTWALHNRRLTAGLISKPIEHHWISAEDGFGFEGEAVGYLLALLKYPEIDVRLLAVEALVELCGKRPDLIEFMRSYWHILTDGQREYVISMLDSLGRLHPELVEQWASWLYDAASGEPHYNIRASLALALSGDKRQTSPAHPLAEKAHALLLHPSTPEVLSPQLVGGALFPVPWTQYQGWVINTLSKGFAHPKLMRSEALRILHETYPDAHEGLEQESAVHRAHNINTNFDELEIAATFDEACRSSVNRAVSRLMDAREINPTYLSEAAEVLRLRDPTDSLVKPVSRPEKVDWLSVAACDADFMEFADLDACVEAALSVEDGFARLFEYTEQRSGGEIGSQCQRACVVRVEMFGSLATGMELPSATLSALYADSRIRNRNLYRFELPWREGGVTEPIVPLVSSSLRVFRGRHTRELAALSGVWRTCFPDVEECADYLGTRLRGAMFSRGVEWQEAFDQGRRLHEPKSSGFLLEVDANALKKLALAMNLRLFARVEVERTTDKYKREAEMQWERRVGVVGLF